MNRSHYWRVQMDRVPDPPGYPDPEPEPPSPGKRVDFPPPPGEDFPDPEQVPNPPQKADPSE